MPNSRTPPRIVIVVGGLSGTLVTLIERNPPFGRGVAYGTNTCAHLLNVPAGRMGAFPDRPGQFFEWVRERVGRPGFPAKVDAGDFLPRCLYDDYIGYVLTEARQQADPSVGFVTRVGEVVDLDELSGGGLARVFLSDGTTLVADHVVLALGNLPGEYPARSGRQVYRSWRYVHTPWTPGVIDGIDPDAEVLIAGQGLTATDIVIQLAERGHRGRISCLSRRGLRPLPHGDGPAWRDFFAGEPAPGTVLALLRRVRAEVGAAAAAGVGWRAVIDAIRPHAVRLWAHLSWSERARFMRHLRPYWEVHRHRLAPEVATHLDGLVRAGKLAYLAGRFRHLEEQPDGLRVVWRPRGAGADAELRVAKLINCTGPRKGVIPGAKHIARGVLEGRIEDAVPDTATSIVLYCAGGNRSALSADNLQRMGYSRVRSLAGGYAAWAKAAGP